MPLGFKKRGAIFIKGEQPFDYFIYLERSRWNAALPDRPNELSVFIGISNEAKVESTSTLFRLTKLKFPSYYGPFFLDDLDWAEKGRLMGSFSSKQVEEIDSYLESIQWHYDSEESLVNLLNEIKTQLINVGLPTLNFFIENEVKDIEPFSLRLKIKKRSNQLYVKQLDPISRFPIE